MIELRKSYFYFQDVPTTLKAIYSLIKLQMLKTIISKKTKMNGLLIIHKSKKVNNWLFVD